jgi:hypothetical protein
MMEPSSAALDPQETAARAMAAAAAAAGAAAVPPPPAAPGNVFNTFTSPHAGSAPVGATRPGGVPKSALKSSSVRFNAGGGPAVFDPTAFRPAAGGADEDADEADEDRDRDEARVRMAFQSALF